MQQRTHGGESKGRPARVRRLAGESVRYAQQRRRAAALLRQNQCLPERCGGCDREVHRAEDVDERAFRAPWQLDQGRMTFGFMDFLPSGIARRDVLLRTTVAERRFLSRGQASDGIRCRIQIESFQDAFRQREHRPGPRFGSREQL